MKTFLIKDKHSNRTIEYANIVEPIKSGDKFLPNFEQLEKRGALILREDFIKYQTQGKTILVNFKGGWCTLTNDIEIVK